MAQIENTVFISYRRPDAFTPLAVYGNLKNRGYDVFFDYTSVHSGDFEQIITANIRARAHFILILTPTALDRCNEPGDWLRREIELAIDEKRNIVPLFFNGFRFGAPNVRDKLTGTMQHLSHYNGFNVYEDFFDEAMSRLQSQFLNVPLDTVLHPVSNSVQRVVEEVRAVVDEALKRYRGSIPGGEILPPPVGGTASRKFTPIKNMYLFFLLILLTFFIWGGILIWNNLFFVVPEPTQTSLSFATNTSESITPTKQPVLLTPTLDIGSTIKGKDDMELLYIPAGEFIMGSDIGDKDEKPAQEVTLDAFWIDKTEITNALYSKCVNSSICARPVNESSYTRFGYYEDFKFSDYPVINVNWNMAKTYCEWIGRRLPTEAEWEKAARGTDANIYPWGNTLPDSDILNYDGMVGDTTKVGTYLKGVSPYGALDMAGNVWEWVDGWYDAYPGNSLYDSDFGTKYRVLRGGSWNGSIYYARSTYRLNSDAINTYINIGFRCAMDATP
jgi:formylglycine-generating enzyme required for sulfatase activity